jgi:hypothetical protein
VGSLSVVSISAGAVLVFDFLLGRACILVVIDLAVLR